TMTIVSWNTRNGTSWNGAATASSSNAPSASARQFRRMSGETPRDEVPRSPRPASAAPAAGVVSVAPVVSLMLCSPRASGAPSGAAFPRRSGRSSLAPCTPQSRQHRTPPTRSRSFHRRSSEEALGAQQEDAEDDRQRDADLQVGADEVHVGPGQGLRDADDEAADHRAQRAVEAAEGGRGERVDQ